MATLLNEPVVNMREGLCVMEIDKEYVNEEDAIRRVGGNRNLFLRLLKQFAAGEHFTSLEDAISAKDTEKVARDAHTLKGVGANLSLPKLTAAAIELEKRVKENADYTDSLEKLREVYSTTLKYIEALTGS